VCVKLPRTVNSGVSSVQLVSRIESTLLRCASKRFRFRNFQTLGMHAMKHPSRGSGASLAVVPRLYTDMAPCKTSCGCRGAPIVVGPEARAFVMGTRYRAAEAPGELTHALSSDPSS